MPQRTTKNLTEAVYQVAKDPLQPSFGGLMRFSDEVLAQKGGSKGLAIYDDLERDAWVYACLHKRKMAVIGRPWVIAPASPARLDRKAADLVKAQLEALDFDPLCYALLDAILKGRSIGEVMWIREGDTLRAERVIPLDARLFAFEESGALRLLTRADMMRGEAVPERKFIVHTVGAKDGNPHGLGIGAKLWWPVFFKRQGLSFWLQFLDKFGAPTAVGKYSPGVNADELEAALARIAHDAGVALPEGASVELLQVNGGAGSHESMVRYLDEQISAAILCEGGKGKGGGGELASAAILRNELRLELVQADSDMLTSTLNRTLIAWIVALNLPGAGLPRVQREIKQDEDLEARAQRDKLIFDMGFKPTLAYLTETYGGEWVEMASGPGALPAASGAGDGSGTGVAQFAETPNDPAQMAIDALLRAFPGPDIDSAMRAMLAPALAALRDGATPDEAGDALLAAFPSLDSSALEELLARAIFVADVWGRLSAEPA